MSRGTAASLSVEDPKNLHPRTARAIAAWIRRVGRTLIANGDEFAPRFTARFMEPDASLAKIVIHRATDMTPKGRVRIVKWLNSRAMWVLRHRDLSEGRRWIQVFQYDK